MPARLIDGRAHARAIREELQRAVAAHPGQRPPGITVIQVGDDPAGHLYTFATRHYCSQMLNFTARSPDDSNATEDPVLRTSNGPILKRLFQYVRRISHAARLAGCHYL